MTSDRTSPVPLYQRVYDTVVERIVCGELGPGAMLPSETDLGAELGVSQGTARKALIELEQRGIVERRQGRGTFVATTTAESALFHFFRLRHADGSAVTPVLETETVKRRASTAEERKAFAAVDRSVFEISRVRSIDGRKIVRETSVVPSALFPGLPERSPLPNALYALYQQSYGVAISRADERLRASIADRKDAALMDVKEGAPLIEVHRKAVDISGRIVELRLSRYVTDDLHYEICLN